jgi:hypothetical protein
MALQTLTTIDFFFNFFLNLKIMREDLHEKKFTEIAFD